MPTHRLARFGVDAPGVLVGMTAGGLTALAGGGVALAHRWRIPGWLLVAGGLYSMASATSFAYTTLHGKFTVWQAELDRLGLAGTESVLDLGCGRGAVLALVAQRLPDGRATGIDLWRSQDQSGNTLDAAAGNLRAEGIASRTELVTGDLRALPFDDSDFDLVLSSLAIHNIPDAAGRDFLSALNPNSKRLATAYVESSLRSAHPGERFQFERHGYFVADCRDHGAGALVFNRTTTLKDSWGP